MMVRIELPQSLSSLFMLLKKHAEWLLLQSLAAESTYCV